MLFIPQKRVQKLTLKYLARPGRPILSLQEEPVRSFRLWPLWQADANLSLGEPVPKSQGSQKGEGAKSDTSQGFVRDKEIGSCGKTQPVLQGYR